MTERAAPASPAPTLPTARGLARAPALALAPILSALSLGVLALGACTRAINPTPEPEPEPYAEAPPPPPLLGEAPPSGPRPADETGLLGGPPAPGAEGGAEASATIRFRRPDGVVVSTMKTIPDPEPALVEPPPRPGAAQRLRPRVQGRMDRSGDLKVTAAPPPLIVPAPPPTSAIAPVAPAPPPAAAPGELAKAPQAPFAQVLALPTPADPKLAALQAATAGADAAGAKLSIADSIAKGLAGEVQLRLPAALAARLRAEAARLGLGAAARTAEVSARLSGAGYRIDPAGPQVQALKPDEEIVFNWRVVPGEAGATGPLKVEAEAALTGEGAARTFALAALEQTPVPPAEPQAAAASSGQTQAKWALAIILVLLAALVLTGIWRNHKERRRAEAERRQRERAASAFAEDTPAETKA